MFFLPEALPQGDRGVALEEKVGGEGGRGLRGRNFRDAQPGFQHRFVLSRALQVRVHSVENEVLQLK